MSISCTEFLQAVGKAGGHGETHGCQFLNQFPISFRHTTQPGLPLLKLSEIPNDTAAGSKTVLAFACRQIKEAGLNTFSCIVMVAQKTAVNFAGVNILLHLQPGNLGNWI